MFLIKSSLLFKAITAKRSILLFALLFFVFTTIEAQKNIRDQYSQKLHQIKQQNNFTPQDTTYINALNKLGEQIRFYNPDSLLTLSKEALKLSQNIDYEIGQINALIGLGYYYSDAANYNKSIEYYQKAFEKSEKIKNFDLLLLAENNLANQYSYKEDFEKALKEYLKGVEIATEVGNIKMLSLFNENIAQLFAEQKDYEEALNYLEIARNLNEKIGDEVNSAYAHSNLAHLYVDSENYENAMLYINKSISVFEKHRILDWLAYAYQVKAIAYLRQHNYKWALFWFNQSKMIHDNTIDDERSEVDLLQGLAETYLGLKKFDTSEKYARKAYNISTKFQVKSSIKDASETLYILYKKKNDFVNALKYHEQFQKLSDTIAKNTNKKNLLLLKVRVKYEKQKIDLIQTNEKALSKQKKYITGVLALLLVFIIFTGAFMRNERIQKQLNKELRLKKIQLEQSEQELLLLNKTKDKLFSIIGHDLRGPIGAFQKLLQMFKSKEIDKKEFLSFVPKLKTDVDHISFTLNNLLSWGQTQLNGTITKPTIVNLENNVSKNINLLSEIAANKSIKVVNNVTNHTMVWTDPDQLDIIIRNLVSNALKFTPEKGLITISADEKNDYWEVSIQDTGVGIDEETQKKIFAKNANVTTYGTANEKGTGLGLTLCKEMVENNKGTIRVSSTPNIGTCFIFTLPKAKEMYEQAS